jgi:hypothetical protein
VTEGKDVVNMVATVAAVTVVMTAEVVVATAEAVVEEENAETK